MQLMEHSFKLAAAMAWLLIFAGCSPEAWLGSSDRTWLWVVVPLATLLVFGASFIFMRRRNQLRRWNLENNSGEPGVQRIVVWTLVVAGLIALVFTIYNVRIEIDPDQKMWNIGCWWLGTAMGAAIALLIGFRLAEPKPRITEGRS